MAIQFTGLASGLDTNSVIKELMQLERTPVNRLETDKSWMNRRLAAFKEFDGHLNSLLDSVEQLSGRDQYYKNTGNLTSTDYFSADVGNDALPGTSYGIEIQNLAQVQKSHSTNGFSSQTDTLFVAGDLNFTVDGTTHTISISSEQANLQGIVEAINEAEIGISAAIINDGSGTDPYRLTLTGTDVSKDFTLDSATVDGSEALGNLTTPQNATPATIVVDGMTITRDTNSIENAIPGVTLDLAKAEIGEETTLTISEDNSAVSQNINAFVSAYNSAISFVTEQSSFGGSDGGVLRGDSGLNVVKRRLQNMLTTLVDSDGPYKALSQIGLATQKNGTIEVDNEILDEAIDNDLDGLVELLAGSEEGDNGIAGFIEDYLTSLTDSTDGFLAGRETSIKNNIRRMDSQIERIEMRLEKREELLREQFNAMEQLVSSMNAQSNFLTQQLSALNNLYSKDN